MKFKITPLLPALCAFVMLFSCNSETDKKTDTPQSAESGDMLAPGRLKTLVLPFTAVINDSTLEMEILRDPAADMSNLTAQDLVEAANVKYPEVPVTWIKAEGGIAYVSIQDANYLTQNAGREGAKAFLAELTFALTELPEIKAVDIRFSGGDHAQPGLYTREAFLDK